MLHVVRRDRIRQSSVIAASLVGLLVAVCGVEWARGQADPGYFFADYPANFYTKNQETGAPELNDRGVIRPLQVLRNQVLTGSVPFSQARDQFLSYYTNYLFRSFTRLDELHKLPQKRQEIVDDLRKAGRFKEVHDALLLETDKYMKLFVQSGSRNFHPAVRFNAMLVIGDLNAEEQGVQSRYPNPLPAALDFMLAEFSKPNQLDSVRLAALIGILRHAQWDVVRPEANRIPAATRQQIAQLMLGLVNAQEPPAGRTPEGHVWMQRRAIEILAALDLVGTAEPVNQAITGVLRDHSRDLSLRLTAAEALGRTIKPAGKISIDPNQESMRLAALLVEAFHRELDRMDAIQKQKMSATGMMPGMSGMSGEGMMPGEGMTSGMSAMMPGAGMSSMMPGMSGMSGMPGMPGMEGSMMMGGPKEPVVDLFRRQLKYEIECVRRGLSGLSRLMPAPARGKAHFEDLTSEINKLLEATDPPPTAASLVAFQKSIKDSLKTLETKTAALLPKPKEPEVEEPASDVPADIPADIPADVPQAAAAAGGNPAAAAGAAIPGAPAPGAPAPGAPAAPGVPAAAAGAPPAAGAPAAANPAADADIP